MPSGFPLYSNYSSTLICDWQRCVTSQHVFTASVLKLRSLKEQNKKKPLGRPKHGWEDNIRSGSRINTRQHVEWIHLGQDKVKWQAPVNMVMNLMVPFTRENFLTTWASSHGRLCFLELIIELTGLPEHSGNKMNTFTGMKQLPVCYLH
jgi:hypothetical protein